MAKKENAEKLDYVRPQILDLGAVVEILGACSVGDFAQPGGIPTDCGPGLFAAAPCTTGGSATAGSCAGGGTNTT